MATSRQLAQQARRDQERSQSSSFHFRHFAQRVRRNQEHQTQVQQLLIARKPLLPQLTSIVSLRHQLGRCNVSCCFCGAEHWIEERVQESSLQAPKFSTCCQGGIVMMDKFDDPPQPLYSLLMDSTPYIFLSYIFADNERLYNSVRTFEIIIMPLHSVPLVSKGICLFMVLKAYIPFVSKDNSVISSDLYIHCQGDNLHFHRSTSTIQIPWNKHNIAYLTIMICLI